ncbi:MAG TPA: hypothetical protein VHZ76_04560 [Gammaproteobacteria bacterium]|jgi:hypothetical protein|nr:hypothetical protein [Gammaproteobacteria bacterium]
MELTKSIHKQAAEHIFKHMAPFVFGHGADHDSYFFNSGTATLIDLGCGPLALTCEHVSTPFREFKATNEKKSNAQLYIGGATGIDRPIIACNKELDIATLQLTTDELPQIPHGHKQYGTQLIREIYHGPIKEGDVIAFSGYPSEQTWRYKTGVNNLTAFHPCACFSEAASINNDYIICQSNHINYQSNSDRLLTLTDDPTGMSGGPAFLIRQENNHLSYFFIGIVSSGVFLSQNCLTAYVKRVSRLNCDGTLKEATK